MPLEVVMMADGTKPDSTLAEIERRAKESKVRLKRVPKRELDANSERGAHQGVMAMSAPFVFTPVEQVIASAADKQRALVIALDQVTDPGNLGAVVRSAEVVGAEAVLMAKRRSAAITAHAYKASAGAIAHVPIIQETNLVRTLERFKEAGFWVAGASEQAEQTVWEAPLEGRIVLVMGSEGEGLSRLTRETCDFLVKLPQVGKVGSLNVAQAATALAYEWLRRDAVAR